MSKCNQCSLVLFPVSDHFISFNKVGHNSNLYADNAKVTGSIPLGATIEIKVNVHTRNYYYYYYYISLIKQYTIMKN